MYILVRIYFNIKYYYPTIKYQHRCYDYIQTILHCHVHHVQGQVRYAPYDMGMCVKR